MARFSWVQTSVLVSFLVGVGAANTKAAGVASSTMTVPSAAAAKATVFPLDIKFDTNKASIKPGKHNDEEFKKLVNELNNYPYARVEIQGYADSTGPADMNKKLSEERAEAIRQRFIHTHGIAADRIQAAGLGEAKPVASNETVAGRKENRRVVATIYRLEPSPISPDPHRL